MVYRLGLKDYRQVHAKFVGEPRSCIICNNLIAYLNPSSSGKDLTTVATEINGRQYWVSSSYMAHCPTEYSPQDSVKRLVIAAKGDKVSLLIACEANSLHTIRLLCGRTFYSTLCDSPITRGLGRRPSQGGVLCPLLYNVVMNKLRMQLALGKGV